MSAGWDLSDIYLYDTALPCIHACWRGQICMVRSYDFTVRVEHVTTENLRSTVEDLPATAVVVVDLELPDVWNFQRFCNGLL